MKTILITCLLSIPLLSIGQSEPDSSTVKYQYCELVGVAKFLSYKVTVQVDFGDRQSMFDDQRIKDEQGKAASFNSMVDAMNYMGDEGWEFVQAYTVSAGNQNVYHWLLKRKKEG